MRDIYSRSINSHYQLVNATSQRLALAPASKHAQQTEKEQMASNRLLIHCQSAYVWAFTRQARRHEIAVETQLPACAPVARTA
jgi:hypothetical protein